MSISVRMGAGTVADGTLMDKTYPPDAWKRLGKTLEARRGELGYGFRQREKFLADRGGPPPSPKMLARLERGERDSYPDATVRRLETLYQYAPGSFEAILAGGEGTPLPAPAPPKLTVAPNLPPAGRLAEWLTSLPDADIERVVAHDPLLRQVWDLQDGTGKPADRAQRIAMLVVVLTPIDPMAMVAERREGNAGLEPGNPPVKGK